MSISRRWLSLLRRALLRCRQLPALLQHPLNIPRRHRSRPFRTEGGLHNQHASLQGGTDGVFSHLPSMQPQGLVSCKDQHQTFPVRVDNLLGGFCRDGQT